VRHRLGRRQAVGGQIAILWEQKSAFEFPILAAIIEDGTYDQALDARYAGWNQGMGKDILAGKLSLADLAAKVDADGINPQPKSGQQEYLENLINRFV